MDKEEWVWVMYPGFKHKVQSMYGLHLDISVLRELVDKYEELWEDGLFQAEFPTIFTHEYGRGCK